MGSGGGVASSAAAWLAGIVAANALLGSPLDRDTLLGLAAGGEGHPDNVAAALLGGLTVACWSEGRGGGASLPVPPGVRWGGLLPGARRAPRRGGRGGGGGGRGGGGGGWGPRRYRCRRRFAGWSAFRRRAPQRRRRGRS